MSDPIRTAPVGGSMLQHAAEAGKERPVSAILQDIVSSAQEIMRSEVRLAKAELKQEAVKAGRGAAMLAAGSVLGIFAVGLLLLSLVYALADTRLPNWGAALLVGLVVGGAAAFLALRGRSELAQLNPTPEKTVENVKENIEWAKHQIKS